MKNTSKVINGESSGNCKPWQAPKLEVNEDNNFDFKLTDPRNITHREQQKKIRQQSYEKSFAKGYMEGLAQGKKEISEQVDCLQSIMASLAMPLPDLDNLVIDEMVQLCIAMVKQMVRRELKASPGEIVAVVKEALGLLPASATGISLELHPEDAKIVRDALMQPGIEPGWKIVEDILLTRGGCRVLTRTSRIDASVEKRLNAVIAEVMGSERKIDQSR